MNEPLSHPRLRIATRASPLALWQANFVADALGQAAPDLIVELVHVTTTGDRDRQDSLSQLGGQGVFTREVQRAVLDGVADVAVHSLKDLPTESAAGLVLAGIPERAARFDALILRHGQEEDLVTLRRGARVGTGSPRRQAQILRVRPDLILSEIRGNVDTRLQKLDAGEFDAVILAEAGLRRLGLEDRITQILCPPHLFPAVGQGALGIECRVDDSQTRSLLESITSPATWAEVLSERACLRTLRAGCHAPVGVMSKVVGDSLMLEAVVLNHTGELRYMASLAGRREMPETLGEEVAGLLLQQGADVLLRVE